MAKLTQIKLDNATYDLGAKWENITGKPSKFPPENHTHNYAGSPSAGGPANSANLLNLNHGSKSSTASTSMSSWTGGVTGTSWKYVWGQSFFDSSIGTDSGDLVFGLRKGEYTSGGTELCLMLDGDYYSMGNKVLHAGNYSSYAATKNHTHSYLPLSGGTLTGALTISNGADLNLQAPSSSSDSGDLVFKNGSGVEIGRIWLNASDFCIRYGDGDQHKTILTSGNYSSYAAPKDHNHDSTYVTLSTNQTISGIKTMTNGLNVSGRSAGGGDDEGIVVGFASNGYAGLCLGGATTARSVFYFKSDGSKPFWRYNNGSGGGYDISHPAKSGTIALTSDLSSYLPLSGGTMSGLLNAHGGISLDGSTAQAVGAPEYILGIKAFAEGGNIIWQSRASVSVGYADSAGSANSVAWGNITGKPSTFTPSSHNHDSAYVNVSGDTMSGALNFANGTWNNVGDDCALGDYNIAGVIGIKGLNGATGIYFVPYSGSVAQKISIDGAGTMSITGKVSADTLQTIQHGITSTIGSQNSGWLHYNTNSPSGHWFNKNVSVQGNIYAGNGYSDLVLTSANYSSYAIPTSYWNWSGQGGQPSWLWGGNEYGKFYVYNPANFSVNYANSSGVSSYVSSFRTVHGNSHAEALQNEFANYKGSLPRNSFLSYYSSAYSNGSYYMGYFLSGYDSNPYGGFFVAHYGTPYYVGIQSGSFSQHQLWKSGDAVTGAVWNDYAECRESDCDEPGYVLIENGDDTLSKSTERLQQFAGISSDTWGFSQGETEKAKTHIAVAGRVLAYPYQDKNNYKPGDAVCAAPGGTVDIMTEEEIAKYPHRIVGIVSCVPNYDEWGGGNDRSPIKVNGRIWIKVK